MQPIRVWVLVAFATIAASLVLVFLVFGSYTRRSRVTGQLVPTLGLAQVLAPATGVVARIEAAEGGRVEMGQTIAVLTVPRAVVGAGETTAALELRLLQRARSLQDGQAANRDLLGTQHSGLVAQIEAARAELAQIKQEIATRKAQVALARQLLERFRLLRDGDFVSELQLKQQQSAALEQVGAMQALQRQALASERVLVQLQEEIRELPRRLQVDDADFRGQLAKLRQEQLENLARGEIALTAPTSGIVATQLFKPGQAVAQGQSLMSVLPGAGTLEAELLVPSRAIGFVEAGDKVLLRYQAYPYQKFGHQEGMVTRISRSALSPAEARTLLPGGTEASEPMYRVTVAVGRQTIMAYGKPEPLKPGLLLEADILGERSRLIEWLIEPLYTRTGRLGSD